MEWLEISKLFNDRWQLPNCIGAIDGKHIQIVKPKHSGSTYINYKGFFSVVLMALVDADYQLLYVDVGAQGRISDGGVFSNCSLFSAMETGALKIPGPRPLPLDNELVLPFYIVGDDAFPLRTDLMKPFSKRNLTDEERVANYRLSRARRVSENAFGIMANVFRVLHTPICLSPKKVEKVVLAICALHNFLRQRARQTYINPYVEGTYPHEAQTTLSPMESTSARNAASNAKDMRVSLTKYFMGPGKVSWQNNSCFAY